MKSNVSRETLYEYQYNKKFKDLINYLCEDNFEALREEIYFQMKEMILNEI